MTSVDIVALLDGARIDSSVREAHPDYVAVLVTAEGLSPGPTSHASESLLAQAEAHAAQLSPTSDPAELPAVVAWRSAYQSFGIKPRQARSSVESLLRRASVGLPRVDRLTDTYNAISVLHLTPIGGEDIGGYAGSPRLSTAIGDEPFDTTADGEPAIHYAEPGEVVWRDDIGVTCRRWNWRQCVRTRLTTSTTRALFIIDGLGPHARAQSVACAEALVAALRAESPAAVFRTRVLPV